MNRFAETHCFESGGFTADTPLVKHANISVFVPHNGCPCRCSFCNQNSITGQREQPTPEDVRCAVKAAGDFAIHHPSNVQIAFFGGSFTAIDRDDMISLLREAKRECDEHGFAGIRVSTRPDNIDGEILSILKEYGVAAVELGAQSMDDAVLEANRRGHTAADVGQASRLIKEYGFELGLQMMTGLFLDSGEKAVHTAEKLIALRPETIRIYPAVVFPHTHLAELMEAGAYRPQTLEEAVDLCARLIPLFEAAKVRVIRVGLHAGDGTEGNILAGPFHPAFGELCRSRIFLHKLRPLLLEKLEKTGKTQYNIKVNAKSVSVAVGQRKANIREIEKQGFQIRVLPDDTVRPGHFVIEEPKDGVRREKRNEIDDSEIVGTAGL